MRRSVLFFMFLLLWTLGCDIAGAAVEVTDYRNLIPSEGTYEVEIIRDSYGVPHIYGKKDADVAYGLGYAAAEDDFKNVSETILMSRGRFAREAGRKGLVFDLLVRLFRFRELVEKEYEHQLSSETRAICQAYADGFNHFAALHAEQVPKGLLPATPLDVVTGFVMRTPFFFGLDAEMRRLMGPKRAREVSYPSKEHTGGSLSGNLPIGSNTFAVSPRRTPDGKTHLAINSHQPFEGPVSWYEVRLKSEEGLDITGGTFPGAPVVLHGHNPSLGWAHTVNLPDLYDIYVLEMHPDDPNKYLFDGEYRELERSEAEITVKLWGNLRVPIKREILTSVHGPVLRRPHGVYAIKLAGYGDIRQVEQWFRMGKARNIAEFEDALRMQSIPSFNVGYADKEGNIWYLYNALMPLRAPGYDWKSYLPGNTSETLWSVYLPFDQLPQVKNPESGFIQNCNSTPFRTTVGPGNPEEAAYGGTFGIEPSDRMTNRALRACEILAADDSITEGDFYACKYDWQYSENSRVAVLREELVAALAKTELDPIGKEALDVFRTWDLKADPENPGTAIAVLALEPVIRAEMFGKEVPDAVSIFLERARQLHEKYGRIDVPWREVNRIVRGDLQVGLGGGPDMLHCIYGEWNGEYLHAVAGDCYVLMVTWDSNGRVRSKSIHQYGSATTNPGHPHFADQTPLFAKRELKPTWLEREELLAHMQAKYRPGENVWASLRSNP